MRKRITYLIITFIMLVTTLVQSIGPVFAVATNDNSITQVSKVINPLAKLGVETNAPISNDTNNEISNSDDKDNSGEDVVSDDKSKDSIENSNNSDKQNQNTTKESVETKPSPMEVSAFKQTISNVTNKTPDTEKKVLGLVGDTVRYTFQVKVSGDKTKTLQNTVLKATENKSTHTDADGKLNEASVTTVQYSLDNGLSWINIDKSQVSSANNDISIKLPDSTIHGNSSLMVRYEEKIADVASDDHYIYNDGSISSDNMSQTAISDNATQIALSDYPVISTTLVEQPGVTKLSSDDLLNKRIPGAYGFQPKWFPETTVDYVLKGTDKGDPNANNTKHKIQLDQTQAGEDTYFYYSKGGIYNNKFVDIKETIQKISVKTPNKVDFGVYNPRDTSSGVEHSAMLGVYNTSGFDVNRDDGYNPVDVKVEFFDHDTKQKVKVDGVWGYWQVGLDKYGSFDVNGQMDQVYASDTQPPLITSPITAQFKKMPGSVSGTNLSVHSGAPDYAKSMVNMRWSGMPATDPAGAVYYTYKNTDTMQLRVNASFGSYWEQNNATIIPLDYLAPFKIGDEAGDNVDDKLIDFKTYYQTPSRNSGSIYDKKVTFSDPIDKHLSIESYEIVDSTGADASKYFNLSVDTANNTVIADAKDTSQGLKNSNFYANTYILRVHTKLDESKDLSDVKIENGYYVFPNISKLDVTFFNDTTSHLESNEATGKIKLPGIGIQNLSQTVKNITSDTTEGTETVGIKGDALQYTFKGNITGGSDKTLTGTTLTTKENDTTKHNDTSGALDPSPVTNVQYSIDDGQTWIDIASGNVTASTGKVTIKLPDGKIKGGSKLQIHYTKTIRTAPVDKKFIYNDGTLTATNSETAASEANSTKVGLGDSPTFTVHQWNQVYTGKNRDNPEKDDASWSTLTDTDSPIHMIGDPARYVFKAKVTADAGRRFERLQLYTSVNDGAGHTHQNGGSADKLNNAYTEYQIVDGDSEPNVANWKSLTGTDAVLAPNGRVQLTLPKGVSVKGGQTLVFRYVLKVISMPWGTNAINNDADLQTDSAFTGYKITKTHSENETSLINDNWDVKSAKQTVKHDEDADNKYAVTQDAKTNDVMDYRFVITNSGTPYTTTDWRNAVLKDIAMNHSEYMELVPGSITVQQDNTAAFTPTGADDNFKNNHEIKLAPDGQTDVSKTTNIITVKYKMTVKTPETFNDQITNDAKLGGDNVNGAHTVGGDKINQTVLNIQGLNTIITSHENSLDDPYEQSPSDKTFHRINSWANVTTWQPQTSFYDRVRLDFPADNPSEKISGIHITTKIFDWADGQPRQITGGFALVQYLHIYDEKGNEVFSNFIQGNNNFVTPQPSSFSFLRGHSYYIEYPYSISSGSLYKDDLQMVMSVTTDNSSNSKIVSRDGYTHHRDGSEVVPPDVNDDWILASPEATIKQRIKNLDNGDGDDLKTTTGYKDNNIQYTYTVTAKADGNNRHFAVKGLTNVNDNPDGNLDFVAGSLKVDGVAVGSAVEDEFKTTGNITLPDQIVMSNRDGEKNELKITYVKKVTAQSPVTIKTNAKLSVADSDQIGNENDDSGIYKPRLYNDSNKPTLDGSFNQVVLNVKEPTYTLKQDVINLTKGQTDSDYADTQSVGKSDVVRYRYQIDAKALSKTLSNLKIINIHNFYQDDPTNPLPVTEYQAGTLKVQYGTNAAVDGDDSLLGNGEIDLPSDLPSNTKVTVTYDAKVIQNRTGVIENDADFSALNTNGQGSTTFNPTFLNQLVGNYYDVDADIKNETAGDTEWKKRTNGSVDDIVDYRYQLTLDKDSVGGADTSALVKDITSHTGDLKPVDGKVHIKVTKIDGTTASFDVNATDINDISKFDILSGDLKTLDPGDSIEAIYQEQVVTDEDKVITNDANASINNYTPDKAFPQTILNLESLGFVKIRYVDRQTGEPITAAPNTNGTGMIAFSGKIGTSVSELATNAGITDWLTPEYIEGYTPIDQTITETDDISDGNFKDAEKSDPKIAKNDQVYTYRYEKATISVEAPDEWYFGDFNNESIDRTYYLPAKKDENDKKQPYKVKVNDYYNVKGWNLSVEQDDQFKSVPIQRTTETDKEWAKIVNEGLDKEHKLDNSNLAADYLSGKVDSSEEIEQEGVLNTVANFDLGTTGKGVVNNIMTYQKGGHLATKDHLKNDSSDPITKYDNPGWGIYSLNFGNDKQADYSVGLHVPESTRRYKTKYTSTLTWKLSVAP